jgi:hypothetical protein
LCKSVEKKRIVALKIIAVSVAVSLQLLLLTSCGTNLSGKYTSESGIYSIEFFPDGTCTWYQSGLQFDGKYYWSSQWERYCLEISGSGSYADTTFIAISLNSRELMINGGKVNYETFTKVGAKTSDIIKIIICIIIIGACGAFIFVFVRRNKTSVTPTSYTDTSDFASPHKNKTHCKTEKESITDSSQITIYYFNAKEQKYICPFCDGENSIEVKICSICGRDLNYIDQE